MQGKEQVGANIKEVVQGILIFPVILWGMIKASCTEDNDGEVVFKKTTSQKFSRLAKDCQRQR